MAAFDYRALTEDGRRRRGVVEADSARHARQLLRERRLAPVSVVAALDPARGEGSTRWSRGLSSSDLALLTRQLATLVQAALPVEEALRAAAAQSERPRVRSMLLAVRGRILEGHGLATGLSAYPRVFPAVYRSTVAAGERGFLGTVLEQLADYTEQRQQSRQKVQLALLYPAILTLVSLAIVGFLLGYVVPDIVDVFAGSGQALPWLTRALVASSAVLATGWPVLLSAMVAIAFGLRRALRRPAFRLRFDGVVLRLPLAGLLVRDIEIARFTSTLAILARSGVPLVEALGIAREVVANRVLHASLGRVEASVREGSSLTRALEQHARIPPMLLHMVAAGERSGDLDAMLSRAARSQQTDLAARVAMIVGLFEPLMLVAMGTLVLLIVLAVLLPIMSLNQLVG